MSDSPKDLMGILGQLLHMLNEEQREAVVQCAQDGYAVVKKCLEDSQTVPSQPADIPDMRRR